LGVGWAGAPALKENFDTPETSIFDELVRREKFQVGFPAKHFDKQVSLVHRFQSTVAEGKRSTAGQLLWLNEIPVFFPKELCIVHDCWVYELLSFDLISCKNQLIRAKIRYQCLHMNSTIICNIGKYKYICMNILLCLAT
jgi:hypothetical protein